MVGIACIEVITLYVYNSMEATLVLHVFHAYLRPWQSCIAYV